MVAKGPHIIPECTAGCRFRWIALALPPGGLLAQGEWHPGRHMQAVGGFVGLGRATPSNGNELMYET